MAHEKLLDLARPLRALRGRGYGKVVAGGEETELGRAVWIYDCHRCPLLALVWFRFTDDLRRAVFAAATPWKQEQFACVKRNTGQDQGDVRFCIFFELLQGLVTGCLVGIQASWQDSWRLYGPARFV